MVEADALTAEYCQMVRTVEVLHTLRVLHAQLLLQSILILIFTCTAILKIEVSLREDWVLFDHFIEDVDVEWETLC